MKYFCNNQYCKHTWTADAYYQYCPECGTDNIGRSVPLRRAAYAPKTHFCYKNISTGIVTVCGTAYVKSRCTTDKSKVTCKMCLAKL